MDTPPLGSLLIGSPDVAAMKSWYTDVLVAKENEMGALTFGPIAALGRFLAAFIFMRLRERKCRADRVASPCVLDQLGTIGLLAFFSALFLALIRMQAFGLSYRGMPAPLLFAGGIVLGLLTPCTVGALAAASGLRAGAAPLALGVFCSAGLFPMRRSHPGDKAGTSLDGRLLYGFIALSCGIAAAQSGAGLVHPKLTPLAALGALSACAAAVRPPVRAGYPALLAAFLMFAGLILHVPPPIYNPGETTLENIYPGQEVRFIGEISGYETPTTLVRYAVTCCRADASPLALRLDRRLNERSGAWIEARGVIERDTGGMHLYVRRYRRIAQPSDPFLYQ